jgi:proteic killer suppression protein
MDMKFPGSDFHPLKGKLRGYYSVHVNGNWTIIFRFDNGKASDVDLVDYH